MAIICRLLFCLLFSCHHRILQQLFDAGTARLQYLEEKRKDMVEGVKSFKGLIEQLEHLVGEDDDNEGGAQETPWNEYRLLLEEGLATTMSKLEAARIQEWVRNSDPSFVLGVPMRLCFIVCFQEPHSGSPEVSSCMYVCGWPYTWCLVSTVEVVTLCDGWLVGSLSQRSFFSDFPECVTVQRLGVRSLWWQGRPTAADKAVIAALGEPLSFFKQNNKRDARRKVKSVKEC